MESAERDRRVAELQEQLAKLSPDVQERVLDGWAQVINLCEMPPTPGETVKLSITLDRSSETTYLSG